MTQRLVWMGNAVVGTILAVTLGLSAGCETRLTAIMLEVTIAEGHEPTLDGNVDELEFHIAVRRPNGRFVIDPAGSEHTALVAGRSLADDPYLLLIKENGDGEMETIRAAVLGYQGQQVVAWGWLEDPVSQEMISGNVVYRTIALYDAATRPPEFFVTALGCVVLYVNGEIVAHAPNDMDCDDIPSDEDCNDEDPTVGPGMPEICGNGVDDNCNGTIDEILDEDGDGFTNCEPVDCDDGDPTVYPGATELCDGIDNDCDGTCDVEFDTDNDGYTACEDGATGSAAGPEGFCGVVPTAADYDCAPGDPAVHPGAAEVCNGVDDNCDMQVDEALSVACYEGPPGTENVGQCRAGMSHCIRGVQTPCIGQIRPIPEACNNLDDNCNGQVDESMPDLTCGLGVCRVTVPYCVGGQAQQCSPIAATAETCNGLDDDCDGLVDEDCGCIHVNGNSGSNANTGGPSDPMLTINAGIAQAVALSVPAVCVASTSGCMAGNWTSYGEDVIMVDGVSVYGGYNPTGSTWTRSNACKTEIAGQTFAAVTFDANVSQRTVLDGFTLNHEDSTAAWSTQVVYIEGSTGAVVSNCEVYGSLHGTETFGIYVTSDPSGNPATPEILSSKVVGGVGMLLSVGIYAFDSAPFIQGNCDLSNINSATTRCETGCWNATAKHIRSHRFGAPATESGYAIWLDESPGAVVDQSSVCAESSLDAAGIKITGNAVGTRINRSQVLGMGGVSENSGVLLEDCGGASPWIAENHVITTEGGGGTSLNVGVHSLGDCHPLIEANAEIAGGYEGGAAQTRGILCGMGWSSTATSQCAIVGNVSIKGSKWGVPPNSVGVLCQDSACALISQNTWIDGGGGVDTVGLVLMNTTGVMVDRNVITSGCGQAFANGVWAVDAAARLQNNVIGTALCTDGTLGNPDFVGLLASHVAGSALELDVHSNAIFGGGRNQGTCQSAGVALESLSAVGIPGGLGIYRNNMLHGGLCPVPYGLEERDPDADPRIFQNNALHSTSGVGALYLDEGLTPLSNAGQVDGLGDMTASGNLQGTCGFAFSPGGPVNLASGSPCRNAGTSEGMPGWDYFGDSRPQESAPDVGPDEYTP